MSVVPQLMTPARRIGLFPRLFLGLLGRISTGHLILEMPGGDQAVFGDVREEPAARLTVKDWRACRRVLLSGDIGFAEALRDGWLETPDVVPVLKLALRNRQRLETALYGSVAGRAWYLLRHWLNRNTRSGSRRNIEAHYDLGNDFYALWLDRSWTYSAALFGTDRNLDLESAQQRKYQRIIDRLELKPGMTVLEIGCGWGGFAEAAARAGIRVHGVTLSPSQLEFATQRLQRAGLADLVTLELRDYRDLTGEYDAVASIEMFEAVGEAFWPTWFDVLARVLKPGARAVVQTITINDANFESYRASSDFIREFIFPGGMLPSPDRFREQARAAGLELRSELDFGRDYAETLRRWRATFEERLDAVRRLGFDEAFIRIWRLYLAYCEAAFDEGHTDVSQYELARR